MWLPNASRSQSWQEPQTDLPPRLFAKRANAATALGLWLKGTATAAKDLEYDDFGRAYGVSNGVDWTPVETRQRDDMEIVEITLWRKRMSKTPEAGDVVVWLHSGHYYAGTVRKRDQYGINVVDIDDKVNRMAAQHVVAVVAVVADNNRLKLAYALNSALKQHRDRLDASHATLAADRETALGKWAL